MYTYIILQSFKGEFYFKKDCEVQATYLLACSQVTSTTTLCRTCTAILKHHQLQPCRGGGRTTTTTNAAATTTAATATATATAASTLVRLYFHDKKCYRLLGCYLRICSLLKEFEIIQTRKNFPDSIYTACIHQKRQQGLARPDCLQLLFKLNGEIHKTSSVENGNCGGEEPAAERCLHKRVLQNSEWLQFSISNNFVICCCLDAFLLHVSKSLYRYFVFLCQLYSIVIICVDAK